MIMNKTFHISAIRKNSNNKQKKALLMIKFLINKKIKDQNLIILTILINMIIKIRWKLILKNNLKLVWL